MLKQKAKASEQATKMALPKPVGSIPDPEYLKPGFLATPPPNLGMASSNSSCLQKITIHNSEFGLLLIFKYSSFQGSLGAVQGALPDRWQAGRQAQAMAKVQAMAKAQAMASQPKAPPTPAMLQAMQGCQIAHNDR